MFRGFGAEKARKWNIPAKRRIGIVEANFPESWSYCLLYLKFAGRVKGGPKKVIESFDLESGRSGLNIGSGKWKMISLYVFSLYS